MPSLCLKMPLPATKVSAPQAIREEVFRMPPPSICSRAVEIIHQLFADVRNFGQHFGDEILTRKPG